MTRLRRLNESGIASLTEFLQTVSENAGTSVPTSLLQDPSFSEELPVTVEVQSRTFGSRLAVGRYLHWLLLSEEARKFDRDSGVWSWLALFYFDELCPLRPNGIRRPGNIARWVPVGHAFRYYRHLLAGPYLVYRSFRDQPEMAMILLCGPLDRMSDYVEQLAGRQELIQNKAVIEIATKLYFDSRTGRPKRGTAPTEHRAGTLRRLVDVTDQLDMTWDLQSLTATELLNKLPGEFGRYLSAGS